MANSRKPRLGSVLAPARGALSMVEAAAEDSIAAVDLFRLTDAEGPPADPFAARSPDYIRATLPTLPAMSNVYFRPAVPGLDRIPAEGPGLPVANHPAGTKTAEPSR